MAKSYEVGVDASLWNVTDWDQWVHNFVIDDDQISNVTKTFIDDDIGPGRYFSVRAEVMQMSYPHYLLGAYIEYLGE